MSTLTQERTTTSPRNGRATPPDLDIPGVTRPLTYDEYLAEETIRARYDVLDGIRHFMPSPTERHQDIVMNLAEQFRRFQRAFPVGKTSLAPRDVLVTRKPLRVRQPDVMFISSERLARNGASDAPGGYDPAPELIVEIISPSDTPAVLAAKIADYCRVNVRECWIVRPQTGTTGTVEVMRLFVDGATETAAVYGAGETVRSEAFPGLSVAVADIFA